MNDIGRAREGTGESAGVGAADLSSRLRRDLGDRYALERELGHGGMATVFLATDVRHHRSVALKVLQPGMVRGTERFLREIQLAAGLSHPHIVPLYDSGEAGEFLYYVMPFVTGESLRDRLAREGALPVGDVVRIGREVAEALAYAHAQGIVHRDIKPENILLSSGHAVVSDFGIARALDAAGGGRITEAGMAVGSPMYMSPEQAEGEPELDGRSDIYSLGCVLYEAVIGKPPFAGKSLQAILVSRLLETPPGIRAVQAALPPGLEAVIRRAMAREPAQRFANAGELVAALGALAAGGSGKVATIGGEQASIAVLPFVNLSPDPDNEYFSDGMTDDLMNALARIPGLRVAARTSAFSFKGKDRDVMEIGERLRVATVLEGSVRKAGNRLRISAQLVNTGDGYQLWSETYERDLQDVFALQDEISRTIAEALKLRLLGDYGTEPVQPGTRNLEAYTLYLKGRFYAQTRTPEGLRRGLAYYEEALAVEPEYARAHAGVAECWSLLGFIEFGDVPPAEAMPRAKAAAVRALELDQASGEAHTILGIVALIYEWDWARAERELRQGIDLAPRNSLNQVWYGIFLASQGRHEEAIERSRLAEALDPLSLTIHQVVGRCLYWARHLDEAIAHLQATLEMDPRNTITYTWLARAYLAAGRPGDAVQLLEAGMGRTRRSAHFLSLLGCAYARLGDRDKALGILQEIDKSPFRSSTLIGLGQTEMALDALEQDVEARTGFIFGLAVDPLFDGLREHPRFSRILESVGLK